MAKASEHGIFVCELVIFVGYGTVILRALLFGIPIKAQTFFLAQFFLCGIFFL